MDCPPTLAFVKCADIAVTDDLRSRFKRQVTDDKNLELTDTSESTKLHDKDKQVPNWESDTFTEFTFAKSGSVNPSGGFIIGKFAHSAIETTTSPPVFQQPEYSAPQSEIPEVVPRVRDVYSSLSQPAPTNRQHGDQQTTYSNPRTQINAPTESSVATTPNVQSNTGTDSFGKKGANDIQIPEQYQTETTNVVDTPGSNTGTTLDSTLSFVREGDSVILDEFNHKAIHTDDKADPIFDHPTTSQDTQTNDDIHVNVRNAVGDDVVSDAMEAEELLDVLSTPVLDLPESQNMNPSSMPTELAQDKPTGRIDVNIEQTMPSEMAQRTVHEEVFVKAPTKEGHFKSSSNSHQSTTWTESNPDSTSGSWSASGSSLNTGSSSHSGSAATSGSWSSSGASSKSSFESSSSSSSGSNSRSSSSSSSSNLASSANGHGHNMDASKSELSSKGQGHHTDEKGGSWIMDSTSGIDMLNGDWSGLGVLDSTQHGDMSAFGIESTQHIKSSMQQMQNSGLDKLLDKVIVSKSEKSHRQSKNSNLGSKSQRVRAQNHDMGWNEDSYHGSDAWADLQETARKLKQKKIALLSQIKQYQR